ncbi:MAG: hypothetical protein WCT14_01965 [Treponemataceae bacterium]
MKRLVAWCFAIPLLFIGCGQIAEIFGGNSGENPTTVPKVYLVGLNYNSSSDSVAAYWTDGVRTDLSEPSVGQGIDVSGSDIYVAGYFIDTADSNNFIPSYWKNGVRTALSRVSSQGGQANCIVVSGGVVYVSGYTMDSFFNNVPCYWVNGTRHDLPLPSGGVQGMAWSLTVENGIVYTAGHTVDGTNLVTPCYWVNDASPTALPVKDATKNGYTAGIKVVNGTVYTSGFTKDNLGTNVACYWVGTARTDLPDGSGPGGLLFMGIAVSGSDIYVSGVTSASTPCYWKNGAQTVLSVPAGDLGLATGIALSGTDVYASGFRVSGTVYTPCYWKNGTRTDLTVNSAYVSAYVLGIKVQ